MLSTEGTVMAEIERPAPGNAARAGIGACRRGATRGDTAGAAPRIGAVGNARPGLLTAGVPSEPAKLKWKKHR